MTTFDIKLFAPSHAVEPTLLAQQLPCLARLLRNFCAVPVELETLTLSESFSHKSEIIHVYAAELGVQRAHITLESLPQLSELPYATLQAHTTGLVADFVAEGLQFIPNLNIGKDWALGTLNLNLTTPLPAAANFVGRDIAHALPRGINDVAAKTLRQFVNAAQMFLHQSPVANVNSLWCCGELPTAPLAQAWLQGGLTAWWDALPVWDTQFNRTDFNINDIHDATQLRLIFSDSMLIVPLKPRKAWAIWHKPLLLNDVLTCLR